nr:RNA-directed DNA polymerase, eukaryota, reverse transcriptase zinc-binding domain protein [Tanacetum cinerariifolium]
MGSYRSKEDEVVKISTSIFVANFPDSFGAKDLWNTCKQYGQVVDAYIPYRISKAGKRFGFIRFIKVLNVDRLVNNLCTVWVGRHKLQANIPRFHREPLKRHSSLHNIDGVKGDSDSSPVMVLDDSCLYEKDYSLCLIGKVKYFATLANLKVVVANEGFDNIKFKYIGGGKMFWVRAKEVPGWIPDFVEDNDEEEDSEVGSYEEVPNEEDVKNVKDLEGEEDSIGQGNVKSEDPFNIYELLNPKRSGIDNNSNSKESLKYPPGYTPTGSDWMPNGKKLLIISVYAPQELSEKKMLWDYLSLVMSKWEGEVVIMGDFNEVRNKSERSATKMSKLYRFLILDSLLCLCPNISSITLDRYLSDHWPILMREVYYDYGSVPFRFFHYWFEVDGFDKFIEDSWKDAPIFESNALIRMMKKLKYLKEKIRMWNKLNKEKSHKSKRSLLAELVDYDAIIDKGEGENNVVNRRTEVVKLLQEVEKNNSLEAAQKAKIKWVVEGDENSKYHGVINKKRNQLSIRGILVEGTWIDSPSLVKSKFLSYFKNRFEQPNSNRLHMNMHFSNTLSSIQVVDLECQVSKEGIKKAVWNYGIDKFPGPDGFTFGSFPKGDNSSFIILILKTPNANMVKDYMLISLTGSMYKIISKILANHLVVVLDGLVNEIQLAFVADKQILDVDVGLFKGIELAHSLNISHMFYVDDAIFMVQWSISVKDDKVKQAAAKIGCNTLKTPFSYLGSKMGGCMSCIQSWNETIERMACRLSKWKLKTLSIGGRLTLLKSMLGSMPIYHMSLFKVSKKVLHRMESMRSYFFNGAKLSSKKSVWAKWKHALASKDKGGSSLWAKVIKALHGYDGKIGQKVKSYYPSLWLDIIHELEMFKYRGIDLVSLIHSKLGNRANTSFWEGAWRGGSPFKSLFPRLYTLETQKKIDVASKLSHSGLDVSFRRPPRGGVDIHQFEHMKEKVKGCILADMMDRWFWALKG